MNKLNIFLLGILVFSLLSFKLTQPFWGHHEFNGVYYGMIAKNYINYGLLETRGAQVNNLWPVSKDKWNYHTHHPATYPLSLAFLFKIFGPFEYVARLLSITASIVGIIFLAKLLRLVFNNKFSWLAVIPLLFTPLFRYYGSLPVFEPLLFPLIALGFYYYWKALKTNNFRYVIAISVAAMLVDWPGFWLPVWLIILEVLSKRRKKLVLSLLMAIFSASIILLILQLIATGSVTDLLEVGKYRLQAAPFTNIGWFRLLISRIHAFLGKAVLITSALGLISFYKKRKSQEFLIVIGALGLGFSHIFVFRNITWYHDYMLYHLLPFFAISMAAFLHFVYKKSGSGGLILTLTLLITISTYLSTRRFFLDLSRMQGHKDCIEMGRQVRKSQEKMTFYLNKEKAKECPPFIGFYGEKPFTIEIEE